MKKGLILLLIIILFLTSCKGKDNNKNNDNNKDDGVKIIDVNFDDNNIILRAPIFSDEHCERTTPIDSNEVSRNSISKFIELVNRNTFDIWLSCGDRSLTGSIDADEKWYNCYVNACSDASNKLFFCHGNHDVYWSGCASREMHYDYFKSLGIYDNDENDGLPQYGNRHKIVNGIDFIAIDITTYDGKVNPISDTTINWAKGILDKVDKSKPVFVLSHATAPNTVVGSWNNQNDGTWGSSSDLYNLVKNYPNVILLTGHTHYDCHDERNIWQGDFTAINVPTLAGGNNIDTYYNGIEEPLYTVDALNNKIYQKNNLIKPLGENANSKYKSSQCLYLEIDKNYNSRITRYDLTNECKVGKSWVIASPKDDKSHLNNYNFDVRTALDKTPTFDGEATYSNNYGTISVVFDAFKHDDMVYAYEVQIYDKHIEKDFDTPKERIVMYPEWYLYKDVPSKYKVKFVNSYEGNFTIRIIGISCFGKYETVLLFNE